MSTRSRIALSVLVPLLLLAGCGDDTGDADDTADDPATSSDAPSSEGTDTTDGASTAAHPCDLLQGTEVQQVLDAPITGVPNDTDAGRECVYEPGADAPRVRLLEVGPEAVPAPDAGAEQVEAAGLDAAFVMPATGQVVTAYAVTADSAYELEVDAGGLASADQVAKRLLPLIAG